ncbi:MAG: hypothetical protein JW841_06460 [Deltaproteobacteria bacterium]|nr:hypothetical protein [Deltaproteobacteria bacterium]
MPRRRTTTSSTINSATNAANNVRATVNTNAASTVAFMGQNKRAKQSLQPKKKIIKLRKKL